MNKCAASRSCQHLAQQLPQHHLRARRLAGISFETVFVHVDALADFQLHRLDVLRRIAILPNDEKKGPE